MFMYVEIGNVMCFWREKAYLNFVSKLQIMI